MKVGIVTFHCSYNFGSALQAYALQEVIRSLGHDATIIDYRSADFDQYKVLPLNHPKRCLKNILNLRSILARRRSFLDFQRDRMVLSKEIYGPRDTKINSLASEFDAFVCGSDQIWNLNCTHGAVGPFFLSFAGNKRRVAYAPSLAHTSFRPEYFDRDEVSSLLAKFDFLSVRETETLPLFQPLVDKRIDVVLDPTLLLGADSYDGIIAAPLIDEPYIFMYQLRNCPELVESTIEMAERTGFKVAYVSEKNLAIPDSVNLIGIGPAEFLSAIANADTVLANSFHATVFSVLFHKTFRSFAADASGARMRNLLGELGLAEGCAVKVDSSPVVEADWDDVDSRLEVLRTNSIDYLRRALS